MYPVSVSPRRRPGPIDPSDGGLATDSVVQRRRPGPVRQPVQLDVGGAVGSGRDRTGTGTRTPAAGSVPAGRQHRRRLHLRAQTGQRVRDTAHKSSEANIIKKKDKLLGRFISYLTCKIRNKDTQYVVLFKHDILGIFIPYFTRQIWNKTTQ